EATSGSAVHVLMTSVHSNTSMSAVAREKCAILHPRVTENTQIPTSAIAVQKRIFVRIDTKPSSNENRRPSYASFGIRASHEFSKLFENSAGFARPPRQPCLFLILEHQSRTLGLGHACP